MGMAASQARFLGLTARMNNIEFEGQQINQQRTALSNKSASYYSDLLGMEVPTAPSVEEFTQTVYTFNDGALTNQITSLIVDPAEAGTYKVSYIKSWTDDFSVVAAAPSIVSKVANGATNDYYIGATKLRTLGTLTGVTKTVGNSINLSGTNYTVYNDAGGYYVNQTQKVASMQLCNAGDIANFEYYLFNADYTSAEQVFKDNTTGTFYTYDASGNKITKTGVTEDDLIICIFDTTETDPNYATSLVEKNADGTYSKEVWNDQTVKTYLTNAQVASITSYSGGATDDPYLSTLSNDQLTNLLNEEQAYLQLLQDNGYGTNFYVRYVQNTSTGEYEAIFYNQADINDTGASGGPVYDTKGNTQSFVAAYKIGSAERIEEVKGRGGCKIEQDSTGRYINLTMDGKTYALSTNTVTDQDAYEDAMNQYEYDKALYDQSIEEVNAKIEIIQAEDKNLELRLKQLDTEHSAVQNEKDAVSKVIEKAVEGGFKTFG